MKLRDLENALQEVRVFENPIAELEQYPTSAHLASQVVHMMDSTFDDIHGKAVCDLGCGTGMLAIAAALRGSPFVLAVDVDPSAVTIAAENAKNIGVADEMQFCLADIIDGEFLSAHPKRKPFDTVILNPPFGTKRKGVDIAFLQTAMQVSGGAVYSMHKTSTRPYILKKAKQWGADAKVKKFATVSISIKSNFHEHSTNTNSYALIDLFHPIFDVYFKGPRGTEV